MSLGEEKTETGIKNPFLEETDPANEELASIRNERKRHKKDTSAEESEIQRLKLELEDTLQATHIEGINSESSLEEILQKIEEIQAERAKIEDKCKRIKKGEVKLSTSTASESQLPVGENDNDLLFLQIKSMRCGTKIGLLKTAAEIMKNLNTKTGTPSTDVKTKKAA
jgi:hypothetical protein